MSKELVPKLRFPEFKDSKGWKETSLENVCTSFSGGTPSTTQKEFYNGDIPFIRSAEIDKETTELHLTVEGLKNSSAKLVSKGDLLIALYGANSGDVALAKVNGAINQAILCLKSEGSNSFIYQFLSFRQSWIISKFIQGGQGNLSGEIVKSIKLLFPKLTEQQKIAACLSSLDELITAQNHKLEALKTHKKGLMQQLFPAEGETVPKLRFAEFKDGEEWKEKQMGKIGKFIGGGTPSKERSDFWQGDIPWISSSDIEEDSIHNVHTTRFITTDALEQSATKLVPQNSILLVSRVGVGKLAISKIALCTSQDFTNFTPFNDDVIFLSYYLKSNSKLLFSFSQGMAIKGFTKEDISGLRLFLPNLKEQHKIATCLSSLDGLIAAQIEKTESLKTHKKGLMQQLFPSINEAKDEQPE